MALMVLGTSSNAGKTTLAAAICRCMARRGIAVAPFKASNLSLNSYVTDEGAEIGMGQAMQAWACGLEPAADMNPVLLKPSGRGVIQYVVNGKVHPGGRPEPEYLLEQACAAYDRLAESYAMVCEGSGSPVEINLMGRDIANLRMAAERGMDIILVGDIERGGVFAALYGTWLLIPEGMRGLVKGFVINRFRGDPGILESGISRIEGLTGMSCLGIMPYEEVMLPEEDSISAKKGGRFSDARKAYMESLDRLADTAERCLDMDALMLMATSDAAAGPRR